MNSTKGWDFKYCSTLLCTTYRAPLGIPEWHPIVDFWLPKRFTVYILLLLDVSAYMHFYGLLHVPRHFAFVRNTVMENGAPIRASLLSRIACIDIMNVVRLLIFYKLPTYFVCYCLPLLYFPIFPECRLAKPRKRRCPLWLLQSLVLSSYHHWRKQQRYAFSSCAISVFNPLSPSYIRFLVPTFAGDGQRKREYWPSIPT
jgi:hypothetical protein